jgi:hypothetical protein
MQSIPQGGGALPYLIPLVVLGLVVLRNSRARTLRIERLWISPTIVAVMAALTFYNFPPSGPPAIALNVAALLLGAFLGWWRARASRFTIDPQTHVITSKVSPVGMLLILGIFALRYVVRAAAPNEASVLHVTALDLTDSFLLMAVGLVSAQRVEWLIRARRMLAEARGA